MGRAIPIYRPGDGAAFLGTVDVGSAIGEAVKAALEVDIGEPPVDGTACKRIGVLALAATAVDDAETYRVKRDTTSKPEGGPKPDKPKGSWLIQSLIFDKKTFTAEHATKWIETHEGFGSHGMDETTTSYRFRQYDPSYFDQYRTKPLAPGVTGVMGRVKEDSSEDATKAADLEIELWEKTVQAVNDMIRKDGIRAIKADTEEEEHFILGLVLEPTDGADGAPLKPDTQKDIYSATEIRSTAHGWIERYGQIDLAHSWEPLATEKVRILESYLAPVDFEISGYKVVKGTWLLALRVLDDEIWKDIKAGKIGAYSVGGLASRTPVEGN